MNIDSKRITKNTLFLYLRFFIILGVNLYSSRIVLDALGATDYGLYNIVYSIVGFLSFLSGTLGSCTSRYLTYELGRGDNKKLKLTFSTACCSHLLLSCIIIVIAETIGLWYIMNIMKIPQGQFWVVMIIYQISIVSSFLSIMQIPFTASLIAHESMSAYAYVGIFEAMGKLGVAFVMGMNLHNKLLLYCALLLLVSLSVFLAFVIYSRRKFQEVRFSIAFDKNILISMTKFSGWNLLANLSNVLCGNAIILLFNVFFSPVIVTAQAIANQISMGMSQLTYNVRSAVNPQIIKLYADSNYSQSRKLTIKSAEFLFDLSMLSCIPCILVMPFLLNLWLVDVPEYTVFFARLLLFQSILDTFNASYYSPMLAANKQAKNSIWGVCISVLQIMVLYILFRYSLGPEWARYTGLLVTIIFSMFIKPYILCKDINYPVNEIVSSILGCLKRLLVVSVFSLVLYVLIPQDTSYSSILLGILSLIVTGILLFCMMSKEKKHETLNYALGFINKIKNFR